MNDEHGGIAFVLGFFIGMISLAALLSIMKATPLHTQRNIHQQAVNLGYGTWVINTDSDGSSPRTSFQWITNTVAIK